MVKIFKPTSAGTQADLAGKVDISEVHGRYFSSPITARAFVTIGINPVISQLPASIKYADLGGGDGYLTKYVTDFMISQGKVVTSTVVDANKEFLAKAQTRRLNILLSNLEECELSSLDLITMRAVNHYNPVDIQFKILQKAYQNMDGSGYLVSQISTGNDANCKLRSAICNLHSLGRAARGKLYEWITIERYISMLKEIGFVDILLAGFAPPNAWTPEEQWERFNSEKHTRAIVECDVNEVLRIEKKRKNFIADTKNLLKEMGTDANVEITTLGSYNIHYQYAILLAKKAHAKSSRLCTA